MALIMEAVGTSETSVYFNETTQSHIPEGCNLHNRRRENLKFQPKLDVLTKDISKLNCVEIGLVNRQTDR
jgi:hypothetical protein